MTTGTLTAYTSLVCVGGKLEMYSGLLKVEEGVEVMQCLSASRARK